MNVRIRPVTATDVDALRGLLRRVSVFGLHEVRVAEELISEALAGSNDYVIHVAEEADGDGAVAGGRIVGYACYGHNPVTDALYDLYWMAVDPSVQGRGVGRALILHTEQCVREAGGRGIVIDTSSRAEYDAARRLYERAGYRRVADIPDFYKPGDGLVMYRKLL